MVALHGLLAIDQVEYPVAKWVRDGDYLAPSWRIHVLDTQRSWQLTCHFQVCKRCDEKGCAAKLILIALFRTIDEWVWPGALEKDSALLGRHDGKAKVFQERLGLLKVGIFVINVEYPHEFNLGHDERLTQRCPEALKAHTICEKEREKGRKGVGFLRVRLGDPSKTLSCFKPSRRLRSLYAAVDQMALQGKKITPTAPFSPEIPPRGVVLLETSDRPKLGAGIA